MINMNAKHPQRVRRQDRLSGREMREMAKKFTEWVIAASVVALFGTLGALNGLAQETQVYPDVLRELKHDTSAPMKEIHPAAEAGPSHVIKLMRVPHQLKQGQADPVVQNSAGPTVSADGAVNANGVSSGGSAPPDANGAVGATQYVQWVNLSYAVFDKATGNVIQAPRPGNSIWTGFGGPCETYNYGDPVALYDRQAGRWVMAQPVYVAPYTYCIAVSTTSDATGSYNRYAFAMPNFNDYPKLGVWPDAYYGSFNLFQGNNFQGAYACAFDRNAMLNGLAATAQCFNNPSQASLLPSDLDGSTPPPAGSPDYFLDLDPGTLNALNLFKFHVDFVSPANTTFTGPISIPVAAYNEACAGGACVPQLGTTTQLDSLGDRLMYRLAYRNFGDHEALVVNHSVQPTAGPVGVRWYEIRSPGNNPTVYQQGTYAPDATYRWMGSMAMDKSGDVAVGYSASSSSIYPGIRYAGRVPTDPLGTLEAEATILQGAGAQINLIRWGDYTSMTVDPLDDCTFWYTNEYLPSSGTYNWQTQIASFKFPSCGAAPAPDFSLTPTTSTQTVTQGNVANYTLDVTPLNGFTGSVNFSVGTLPLGVTASFNPTSSPSSTVLSLTTASAAPPGAYTVTVTGTSGALSHSVNLTLVINPDPSFAVSAAPGSISVKRGSTGSYTVTVTGTGGFAGAVTLSVAGLPRHVSGGFSPATVAGSGTSTLVLSVAKGASAGTYHLTITGSSGGVSHSASVNLTAD